MKFVVGLTGGIAAYKAVGVIRLLVEAGHEVDVVPTASALRFVGRPTLEALSGRPVTSDLFDDVPEVRHVALGQNADAILVLPATANTMARLAAGLADDLLGTTILAARGPLVLAPAMHTEMWTNAATQANLATLRGRGVHVIGPDAGRLTGADSGPGRLAEPERIVREFLAIASGEAPRQDLRGLTVLLTAGGTREPLDPVRFLGNRSSGRQGTALAAAAVARGAEVVLVAGAMEVPAPAGVRVVAVETAEELRLAVEAERDAADLIIMAAAVADYRPETVAEGKITKDSAGDELTIRLVRTRDVLQETAAAARPEQCVVGFAAETVSGPEELLERGRAKLERKGADYLVLNAVGWAEGFGTERNTVTVIARGGDIVDEASASKMSVAHRILDAVTAGRPADT